jgi:hypothetical protein
VFVLESRESSDHLLILSFRSELVAELRLDVCWIEHVNSQSMLVKLEVFEISKLLQREGFSSMRLVPSFNVFCLFLSVIFELTFRERVMNDFFGFKF